MPTVLVNEFKVPKKALAKSFEAYYGVKFMSYEERIIIPKIKELIQNRAHMEEIRKAAVNEGMRTLKQDGIRKVFEGLTDFTQVRRVCII